MEKVARVLIYGDIHLCSKDYGAHRDYPAESLNYFREITRQVEEMGVTHLIGLGDLTYGRFHTLEYRRAVEEELEKQYKLVGGRRYELKGNHDVAGYGMTEYEYYIDRGLLKPATNLRIGKLNLSMVNYGESKSTEILNEEGKVNVVLAHDYFRFEDTDLPDYGSYIDINGLKSWYGINHLIVGHIHKTHLFKGTILGSRTEGGIEGRSLTVHYPGCLCRPSYREGHMDLEGTLVLLEISESGNFDYKVVTIPLLELDESFNLSKKEEEAVIKERKESRIDISDIINNLDSHTRSVGDPEQIISNMENIPDKYKDKAIELLKLGQA